jgi:hypothetical protein
MASRATCGNVPALAEMILCQQYGTNDHAAIIASRILSLAEC